MTRSMEAVRARLGGFAYGGDYNPEQWSEDVWVEDLRLMREAKVSLVSVGIFSWARVEPRPGQFDFAWFDRVLDGLAENGIGACLATMTASPPAWLGRLYPETLPVTVDGTRLSHGSRQHYCPSSPIYRERAAELVRRIGERYGDHPAVALWHINNEYGCHLPACYCDESAVDFRRWLRSRYTDIDELNTAWYTDFWAQRYTDWDEILPPRAAPFHSNPGQRLDFARFTSDAFLACYRMEADILRAAAPSVPATTNFISSGASIDAFAWAEEMDVVSYDAYPDPWDRQSQREIAFNSDLMRSLRAGQPWLLMEQATSGVNWRDRNSPKAPGVMRLDSWQAVAQGADAVMFFQWRASQGGTEKFHAAMVPHAGENTRIFREVCALGDELARAREVAGSRVVADVALLLDWSSWWALEMDSHPSVDVRQVESSLAHYAPLFEAGVACDVVHPESDLSGYRLVIAPNLYSVSPQAATNLREYVRGGGHLAVSFFSGIVDDRDQVYLGGYPGAFRDVLGVWVEEFWPLPENGTVPVRGLGDQDTEVLGTVWSEQIHLEGAAAVASFAGGELAGSPAITRNEFGSGVAWYLGTRLPEDAMRGLVDGIRAEAGVAPVLPDLPAGVRAWERVAESGERYLLVLNRGEEPVRIPLPTTGTDVLQPGDPLTEVAVERRGVAVLRLARD
ncbi:beta-galactosidase [Actinoalloteichus sp. AHMU CJ021]|uniref:beta-galactosidase n=1 Tax=Actinoalloteichus sp. AHMU CJ021 TaxID=2072503 RepID=UPI0026AEA3E8